MKEKDYNSEIVIEIDADTAKTAMAKMAAKGWSIQTYIRSTEAKIIDGKANIKINWTVRYYLFGQEVSEQVWFSDLMKVVQELADNMSVRGGLAIDKLFENDYPS